MSPNTSSGDGKTGLHFILKDVPIGRGRDVTLAVEGRATPRSTKVDGRGAFAGIPRTLKVKITSPDILADHQHAELSGLLSIGADFRQLVFTFRTKKAYQVAKVDLALEIEGEEGVELRAFRVHAEPDAMAREFKNGVVLANMSRHRTVDFDLKQLFGKARFRRLAASDCQKDGFNTGAPIKDGVVNLGPELGIFLRREL